MAVLASILSVLALAFSGLPFFETRSPRTLFLLVPTFLGGAWAPYVAMVGALGAALGLVAGSWFAVVTGSLGAALAVDYVLRVTRSQDDAFTAAFGDAWRRRIGDATERRMLRSRWGFRAPHAPDARVTRDVPFASVPGRERPLLCDVWQPPDGVPSSGTAVVYLHGSAWYLLDKDVGTRPLFRHLASQGHVVIDVGYRLCPETDFVGMVADAKHAIAWTKTHAGEYGVRADRVALMGGSAGAHVALLAAYSAGHPELTPSDLVGVDTSVRAVISFYGVADMRLYERDARRYEPTGDAALSTERPVPEGIGLALSRAMFGAHLPLGRLPPPPPHRVMMRELVGGMPEDVGHRFDLASPTFHANASCPATLLLHAAHDHIVPRDSLRLLRRKLVDAGVTTVCIEYPRTGHAFDLIVPALVSPAGQSALYDVERFLACASLDASEGLAPAPPRSPTQNTTGRNPP